MAKESPETQHPDENGSGDALREDLLETIDLLERVARDRSLLLQLTRQERSRLLGAAGQVAHPGRAAKRRFRDGARLVRKTEQDALRDADEQLLGQVAIRSQPNRRRLGQAPPHPLPATPPPSMELDDGHFVGVLNSARNCYICKRDFRRVHFFYDSLCPDCAEFNWQKRHETTDLRGRYALLTGGRVKIGFYTGLKLLQAGAHLIVTTRFPKDAVQRYVEQPDSPQWIDRLQVHGIDLRHTPSVEAFAEHLVKTLPRLDFILNNACQTVRRPPGFYAHLMESERRPTCDLPSAVQETLAEHEALLAAHALPGPAFNDTLKTVPVVVSDSLAGIQRSAELSQIPLLAADVASQSHFPAGEYDQDAQQVDLRAVNSWRLKLADVPTVELLEVHLVNAVAPFILNAKLKPLMLKQPSPDKHIVNVSAMEGVFYRAFKRDTHPHTNMAKAALNMLTRTSAADYVRDGIHMNSVDTGWITDEDPADITARKHRDHGFRTPLDHLDAASRICDPIISGLRTGNHIWGKFLKDYQVANW